MLIKPKLKPKVCQGMLFDSGNDYRFSFVPVPFRPGVNKALTVDDLYTAYWVHSQPDYDGWENLTTYKCQISITVENETRFYSVHFADQSKDYPRNYGIEAVASPYYEKWLGAMLVLRTNPDGEPMTSGHEDILYIKELLHRYVYFLISKTIW